MVSRPQQPRPRADPARDAAAGATGATRALLLVGCVWLELGAVQWLWPGAAGVAGSFAGALALTLAGSRRPREPTAGADRTGRAAACVRGGFARFARGGLECLAWGGLGAALHPWIAAAAALIATGQAALPYTPHAAGVWRGVSLCVLAPAFEETLYRGRLFEALARSGRAPRSVIVTAFFFALPHAGGLAVFAVFLAGLALGSVRAATGRLAPCIALHAGLNTSALVRDTLRADSPATRVRDVLLALVSS